MTKAMMMMTTTSGARGAAVYDQHYRADRYPRSWILIFSAVSVRAVVGRDGKEGDRGEKFANFLHVESAIPVLGAERMNAAIRDV